MADLNQVRIQVLDAETGSVIDNVDVKTSDGAVYLPDGSTLRSWIAQNEEAFSEFQQKVTAHLAKQHVDPSKVDSLFTGMSYNGNTGVFTITKHNGQTQEIDTLLEKVTVNFTLVDGTFDPVSDPTGDPSAQGYFEQDGASYVATEDTTVQSGKTYYVDNTDREYLALTAQDGTVQKLDVTKLVDVYTGSNANGVTVTVAANKQISASINDGSISYAKLDTALKAKVDAEYTLPAATTSDLGGVKVGNGIAVANDGTISANNISYGGNAVSMALTETENTVVTSVAGPADAVVTTTVGTAVAPLVVSATFSGDQAANASATYQWYKKTIGHDVAFSAISGATSATLAAADISVAAEGSTIYYCVVGATGTDVVADPVTSKRVTVVVNAAA